MSQSTYAIACGAILAAGMARYLMSKSSDGLHTFPGPPQSPFVGNVKQFPKDTWLTHFNAWREEYGMLFESTADVMFTPTRGRGVYQDAAASITRSKFTRRCRRALG